VKSPDSLLDLTVARFLEKLSSDAPTPGGGSAAAVAGTLSAALGRMVCALTMGKPKFAAVEAEVRELAVRFDRARSAFERLVDEDADAYGALSAAFKIPRDDSARPRAIRETAMIAAAVPLETATIARRLLPGFVRLRQIGNPSLVADIEAGSALAMACASAAVANVRANLPLLDDQTRSRYESALGQTDPQAPPRENS
jgi:glutamate formiminotransferase/formiminotetrahydrofolate cyclodeaminase